VIIYQNGWSKSLSDAKSRTKETLEDKAHHFGLNFYFLRLDEEINSIIILSNQIKSQDLFL